MNLLKKTQKRLEQLPHPNKLIVGCSGGIDSVALTHILKELNYDLVIAHFNHGWRGAQSDADEGFVKVLAKQWNLAIEIGRGQKPTQGNAENQARQARYAFLEEVRQKHKADYIVFAHHQDDQMETILMHQKRGAGLRGLAGMTFQRGYIIRPLLDAPKQELLKYAKTQQLIWREDISNQDLSFTRNHLRHVEMDKFKTQDPDFGKKLLQKSQRARQKLEELEEQAQQWLKKYLKNNIFNCQTFAELTDELQSEILIQLLGPVDVYQSTLTRLKTWIQKSHSGTRLIVKGQTFWREHENIYIQNSSRESILSPAVRDKIQLKKIRITKKTIQWGPWQIQNLSDERLFVRSWQPGDRFRPSGMNGSKKVQDFFVDQKIPLHERRSLPLILNEKSDIISIASLRFSEKGEAFKTKLKIKNHERP